MFLKQSFRLTFVIATFFALNLTAFGQKKMLTDEQLLTNKLPNIVNALPMVSWDKSGNLLISVWDSKESKLKKTYYNPATGVEINNVSANNDLLEGKRIIFKDNDLFLSQKGENIQLTNDKEKEVNPTFSPDSNYVAYTKNNNLFIYDLQKRIEKQLTFDGSETVLNGYASWVYMEEILGRASRYRAFWWSPDSKSIAFFRSDESQVPIFYITNAAGQHGEVEKTRYPKAGDPNPQVKVGIASIDGTIAWSDFNEKEDQYFGMPYWKPDGELLVPWMNRDQNDLKVYQINLINGQKKLFYEEQQKTWINLDDNDRFTFLKNGNTVMMSDRTGWMHIYLLNAQGQQINPVTSGNFTVLAIQYIDEKKGKIYFTARGRENTARTDFYSVSLNGKNLKRLTFGDYNHRVQMSPDGKYFTSTYSNAYTPTKVSLFDVNGKKIKDLGDARGEEFDQYQIAKTELIRVKSDDGKYDLPAMVTWPMNMDPTKKYPVLISIYGGPNAGTVWDNFVFNANQQWYAKEGLIQIAIDHRASGQFGKEGVNYMYHNLGYWEMKDYSTVVKYLIDKGYADPDKICITGFSYGGYMSCYALTYGADVFKYAMAGGSVTDWSLYDSHYTERYMGTPQNNPNGYKSSSVFTWLKNYKGGLQLVHGEIDDNVHLQQSLQLAGKLQDLKMPFEMMIYPGGRHGWAGNKQLHFQNLKTAFIYKNLLNKEVPEKLWK